MLVSNLVNNKRNTTSYFLSYKSLYFKLEFESWAQSKNTQFIIAQAEILDILPEQDKIYLCVESQSMRSLFFTNQGSKHFH